MLGLARLWLAAARSRRTRLQFVAIQLRENDQLMLENRQAARRLSLTHIVDEIVIEQIAGIGLVVEPMRILDDQNGMGEEECVKP